jgi:phosphatidylglycerophosphatase A
MKVETMKSSSDQSVASQRNEETNHPQTPKASSKISLSLKLVRFLQKTIASLFFIGYFPLMPGTIGSAVVVLGLWYLQFRTHLVISPQMWWIAIIAFSALSIGVSSNPKENFRSEDPPQVIIDECAGQFIAFFLIPLTLNTLLLGFLLFRFFDIVKPFPIYKMEELDGGVGITMDDIMAGVFANISLMAILFIYHLIKNAL